MNIDYRISVMVDSIKCIKLSIMKRTEPENWYHIFQLMIHFYVTLSGEIHYQLGLLPIIV